MVSSRIKKAFIFLLLVQNISLFAGAVARIDRADLKDGRKIILLSEYHKGPITPAISAEMLAPHQYRIFEELFHTMIPRKQNYAFYIEQMDPLKNYLLQLLGRSGDTTHIPGYAPSWFDRVYLAYIYGQQNLASVDFIKNFDRRTDADWLLQNVSAQFDNYYRNYRNSGFNPEAANELQQAFFNEPDYKEYVEAMPDYNKRFLARLAELKNNLKSILTKKDFARLETMIDQKMWTYPMYLNALQKAQFANKTFFEFLFEMSRVFGASFYEQLSASLYQGKPVASIFELTSFTRILADLGLLEVVLTDRHPVLLVSSGAYHATFVMDFLRESNLARSVSSLDMLAPHMIDDSDAAVAKAIQFVNR